MVHFSKLRLTGFKSFVDPTELVISPGLTGIVGPNGCGKSNLVEALRWVMGEASPKRLRGGEMDDVIFAGSGSRPARNLAEVALTIDNSARNAPFAYNESATIEVVRRIARGGGSAYRINGREARARDVQLLFADAATGPHSGALVGQGRIGALIAAKPTERRLLLDEAALRAEMVARCAPPDRYFALIETLFATQDKWVVAKDWQTALQHIAQLAGVPKAKFDSCVADKALEDQVAQSRLTAASKLSVNSTPTFFINGKKFDGEPTYEAFDKVLSGLAGKS